MCGIAGYSLSLGASVERTLAAQALLAAIAERGADAVGYAYRAPGSDLADGREAADSCARGCSSASRSRATRTSCSSTCATTRRAIRRSRRTTTPSATGRSSGSTTGSSSTTTRCSPATPVRALSREMTVDSEAIFAARRALAERCAGARAAARRDGDRLDRRARARSCLRSPAASAGRCGSARAATRSSSRRRATRSRSLERTARQAAQARAARGDVARAARRRGREPRALPPRPEYVEATRCRPCAHRRKARSACARSSPRLAPRCAAAAGVSAEPTAAYPSRSSHVDALVDEPLADEELERRPGAAPRVEHAVDLPLGQHAGVRAARLGPVGELRQPPEPARQRNALVDRALQPLLPHRRRRIPPRAAHSSASRTCASRATSTACGRGARRGRARSASGRAPRRASRSSAEQLLARREAARHEPGGALGRVPRAEVLDHGLRMHRRLGVRRELLHRRRASEPLGARAQLRRGSARRCSACGSRPGTRPAPAGSIAATAR